MNAPDVIFPYLGIEIQKLNRVAFSLFGMEIYWYGILVVLGIGLGVYTAWRNAGRDTKRQNDGAVITQPQIIDFAYIVIPLSIVGTRLYYVASNWHEYQDNLLRIFAFREGGLAIYGAIITAVLTAFVYARIKKYNFFHFVDICALGLPIGQAIGRWGNFFNQEVFGGYSDGPLAMCYRLDAVDMSNVTQPIVEHLKWEGGVPYIQVHPTFLYESLWCIGIYVILMLYFNRRKFNGEILTWYLLLYGVGRFWIEGIRTDQLMFFNTDIPSAQVVSIALIVLAGGFILFNRIRLWSGSLLPLQTIDTAQAAAGEPADTDGMREPEARAHEAASEPPAQDEKKAIDPSGGGTAK